jgi:hypothetical protein
MPNHIRAHEVRTNNFLGAVSGEHLRPYLDLVSANLTLLFSLAALGLEAVHAIDLHFLLLP